MKRLIPLMFIVALLLVACAGDQPEPAVEATPTEQVAAVQASATETEMPLPTDVLQATAESATEVPTSEPTAQLPPTATAAVLPSLTPPPLPGEETAAIQVISGQTAEGAYFLGDPNAPVTVIDYSDFL
ncbi:MAG: hypothetical protein GWP61_11980 [Chloroflexi bacterium]|nr:hypothetical protein [Chloroflexota bacterium]